MRKLPCNWVALTSSVGRRTLAAFAIATLIPALSIALLANYSYIESNAGSIDEKLQTESRSLGLALQNQLKTSAELLRTISANSVDPDTGEVKTLSPVFDSVEIRDQDFWLTSNRGRILIENDVESNRPQVAIVMPVAEGAGAVGSVLIGRLSQNYLWNVVELVDTDSCVLLPNGTVLYCSNRTVPPLMSGEVEAGAVTRDIIQWDTEDSRWRTAYWELFLPAMIEAEPWIIAQTSPDVSVSLWSRLSGGYFIPILLLLILSPLLVASIQIRKTMQPIDGLMEGIQRIAHRDHNTKIKESGPEEFVKLARSINSMSSKISSQIDVLNFFSDIDRVLLSKKGVREVSRLLIQLLAGQPQVSRAYVVLVRGGSKKYAVTIQSTSQTSMVEETRDRLSVEDVSTLKRLSQMDEANINDLPDTFRQLASGEGLTKVNPVVIRNKVRALLVVSFASNEIGISTSELLQGSYERLQLALEMNDRNRRLLFHASRDGLTQLANKHMLDKRLRKEMEDKRSKASGSLLYIDLDFFKSVNDIAGHVVGDRVLTIVAKRIKRIFSADATVARIGGDEFAVLIPNVKDTSSVAEAADEIVHSLSRPIVISGIEHQLGASIGVARFPEDGENLEDLLFKADLAMYEAKNAGRNTWKYFQPKMKESVQARVSFESELRKAVEHEELTLYVQPQMNLKTGEVNSGEFLLRWFHKDLGPVSPAEFIPVAEETGLIVPMGEWVMHQAARLLREWSENGSQIQKLAVNVSLRQFINKGFRASVEQAMKQAGPYAGALEIEITESLYAGDARKTIEICEWIKSCGLSIAIDDFGTGYSSLGYLNLLPFDTLKVDRVFIEQIDGDPPDTTIIDMILDLARHMSRSVVAEGVSSPAQLRYLQQKNCHLAQGFLIAQPVPTEQFTNYLGKSMIYDDFNNITSRLQLITSNTLPEEFADIDCEAETKLMPR